MAKKLTPKKAKEILHDGTVHGKPLTGKQKRFFGWMSQKHYHMKPYLEDGGVIMPDGITAQAGTTVYVSNPNDPRLKSYQDSLFLFNNSKAVQDYYKKQGYKQENSWSVPSDYINQANAAMSDLKNRVNKRAKESSTLRLSKGTPVPFLFNNKGQVYYKDDSNIFEKMTGNGNEIYGRDVYNKAATNYVNRLAPKEGMTPLLDMYNEGFVDIDAPTQYLHPTIKPHLSIGFSGTGAKRGNYDEVFSYDLNKIKPTQPVIYYQKQDIPSKPAKTIKTKTNPPAPKSTNKTPSEPKPLPENPLTKQKPQAVPYEIHDISIQAGTPTPQRLEQPKTPFSFTFRDENNPTRQSTQYFPNLESWKQFTEENPYISRDVSGDNKSAQGVGYRQFKGGGNVIADDGTGIVYAQDGPVAHAGPGYQGLGYSNSGYNYNSAWGGRFEMGGYIPEAQAGIELGAIPTQETYMGRPVGNKLTAPPLGMSIPLTTEAQRYSNHQKSNYIPDSIGPAPAKRSALSKGLAMAAHPMTTAQYLVKNQDIPDYLEKNPNAYDYATPFVNPASSIYAGFQVPGNLNRGEYMQAGLNTLAVLPGLKSLPKATRAAINAGDRAFSPVGRALNKIEQEGLAAGMSEFDIAKRQLNNVGITSNQREGYIPGLSEFARKYVTPYGYTGAGHNKLQDVLQNIKRKGVNYSTVGPERSDAWNMYLGFPQKNKTFILSETAPINHSAYSSKQLKDMDIYNLSGEQLIADNILEDARYPNPNTIEKNFDALKKSSFVRTDPNGVMGNYNLRFTDEGLQYNDIWDLHPEITPSRYLPSKLKGFAENSPLFNKTIIDKYGQYLLPRTIKIDVGKFLGKPFMSHGNIPSITKESFKESFQKGLVERLNEAKELQKTYGYDLTPKIEKLQKQIQSINPTETQFQMGGSVGGGSLPGATGMMYARTGPTYRDKKEAGGMLYYEQGLDWQPRSMQSGGQMPTSGCDSCNHSKRKAQAGTAVVNSDNPTVVPIYTDLPEFLERNKNAKTYIDKKSVPIFKGISSNVGVGDDSKKQIDYCHPDDEQCTARANRMVAALVPGTSYFENPDVTKKRFGADYSTAGVPTAAEVEKYPYFAGDTKFGSLDAWDIVPTAKKSYPENVLFDATSKSKKYEDVQKNRLTYKEFIKKFDAPIGSFINTGLQHKVDEKGNVVQAGGSHTMRVVGYLESGEPLVADYGHIKPLSESMYTYGDKDQPFIAGVTTVPGKEKYNFKYFKDQKELSNKPSDASYITDFSDKSEDYKKFHDTIAKNKNYVVANLGISPDQYDEYAKIALTLGGHETEFGKGTTYKFLDWLGDSTGVAQINESNVDDKYKKTLSKYKKGSKEYNALATVLYMNELNKYKDKWSTKGQAAQERPYKRREIDSRAKELYRNIAQGKSSAGYINSAVDSDEYRDEKGTLELPYKTPFQSDESYKKEVNAFLAKSRPDLRFDYDKKGERVIYKKTQGNKIPNTLKDFVFYAYNTPTTVMYGDAQGDSKYYQKMNSIYNNLFGGKGNVAKKEQGGSVPVSSRGLYDHPNQVVDVPTSDGSITMADIDYPVYGVDNTGMGQMMMPGGEYEFDGDMVRETPMMKAGGEMIKRADGSYSRRGLWDNIRANKGSGKEPTKEMLKQERKIKRSMEEGGVIAQAGTEVTPQAPPQPSKKSQLDLVLESPSKFDSGKTFHDIVKEVATEFKVDPRLLWSSSFVEGMNLAALKPNQVSNAYLAEHEKNSKILDYPVDGFYNYGLDNFGDTYPELVKRGYLPKDFDYYSYKTTNEQNRPIKTAAFRSNRDAVMAKAAYLKYEADRVKHYATKQKLELTPDEQAFFTMAAYNGGLGSAQAMLEDLKKSGLTPSAFIKQGKTSKGQVYKNVKPRYDMMFKVANMFEAGGEVKTIQDMGQLKKLDQLINFTNYNYYE